MSQPRNPYASKAPAAVTTEDEDNVSMRDSPSSKNSSEEAHTQEEGMEDEERSQTKENDATEEEINFEEDFQIPPPSADRSTKKPYATTTTLMSSGHR